MGIIDKMKRDVANSGKGKSAIFYVKDGQKARVRFLKDLDEGIELTFHDSFTDGINVMCRKHVHKKCKYCNKENLRTRSMYAWPIYNYETKSVQIFLFAVNKCSPLPAIMALYETYDTIKDRDFVISVSGKQSEKTYAVVPMDKNRFKNKEAKPMSEEKMIDLIDKAFPEGEHKYESKNDNKGDKKNNKNDDEDYDDYEEDCEDDEDDDDEEDGELDYSEMSAKELYKLCKERDIKAAPKKSEKFYIKLLEKWDEEHADDEWDDEEEDEEDDEWEEE